MTRPEVRRDIYAGLAKASAHTTMTGMLILLTSLVVIASSQPLNEDEVNVAENSLLTTFPKSTNSMRILRKRQAGGEFDENSPPDFGQRGPRNRTNNSGNRRGPPGSRNMTGCPSQTGQGGMVQRGRGQGGMGQGGMGQGGMGQGGMGQGGMGQGGMGQGGMGPGGMGGGGPRGPPPDMEDSSLVKNDNEEENRKAYGQGGGGGRGRGGSQMGGMGCGNFTRQGNSGGSRRGPPQGGNMMGPPPDEES